MAEHKGTITLIIAVLALFALFVTFGTEVISPLMDSIGAQFTSMVTSIFGSTKLPS